MIRLLLLSSFLISLTTSPLIAADLPAFMLNKDVKIRILNLSDGQYYTDVTIEEVHAATDWVKISYDRRGTLHPGSVSRRQGTLPRSVAWIQFSQVTSIRGVQDGTSESSEPEEKDAPE